MNTHHIRRDTRSNALLNTDVAGFQAARKRKDKMQRDRDRINTLERDLAEMKTMFTAIMKKIEDA